MNINTIIEMIPVGVPLLSGAAVFLIVTSGNQAWDRIAAKYVGNILPTIDRLNINKSSIPTLLRVWGLLILVALIIGFIAPPLAIAMLFFVYIAPKIYLELLISRRRVLLRDQLVGATEALANTTRAGLSLSQGIEMVGRDCPNPLSTELETIVSDYNHGLPLSQAIANTKRRLDHESFTLMAAALLTSLERGGNISVALERISASLKENQRLERKLEADTAGGRRVLIVLAVFPVLFLLLFLVVYPEGTLELIGTFFGQVILLIVIAMVYFSVAWGQKILTLE